MKTIKYVCIMLIALVPIMGCSGTYRKKLETIDSKVTHQELIDSWSDYNISYHTRSLFGITVIVFDPKNDDNKILVGSNWGTVNDQKTWTEFAKANKTSDGNFKLPTGSITPTQIRGTTGVLGIWGPDNQQYGFFIRQERLDFVFARMVDENTLRVSMSIPTEGAGK